MKKNNQNNPQRNGYPAQGGYGTEGYPGGMPYPAYPQQPGYPQQGGYNNGMPNSMYQQQPMNAAPYRQGYSGPSVHGGGMRSVYQQPQSQSVSVTLTSKSNGESAFKKRLSNFLDDDDAETTGATGAAGGDEMSKEDMLKQAKDRKKVAKANLNFKKKM